MESNRALFILDLCRSNYSSRKFQIQVILKKRIVYHDINAENVSFESDVCVLNDKSPHKVNATLHSVFVLNPVCTLAYDIHYLVLIQIYKYI